MKSHDFQTHTCRKYLSAAVFGGLLALNAGCGLPREVVPVEQQYVAPHAGAPTAVLYGSTNSGAVGADPIIFVRAVDGKRVMGGSATWRNALSIEAGERRIDLSFKRGRTFFTTSRFKPAQFLAGHVYELQCMAKLSYLTFDGFVDAWIIDRGTGEKVTEVAHLEFLRPEMPAIPIYLPK